MVVKKPIQQNTLSSQVKNYILQLISEQKLMIGMVVPSEMQLIQELGVSRGVVREAYRSLGALGILEIKSGKVPTIKKVDASVIQNILDFAVITEQMQLQDIFEVRRSLEISAAELAATNGTTAHFNALKKEMAYIKAHFNVVDDFIKHDLQFHMILAQASGNVLMEILLESLHVQMAHTMYAGLVAQRKEGKVYAHKIIELHQKVCDAVCARSPERANSAMREHFSKAIDALVKESPQ